MTLLAQAKITEDNYIIMRVKAQASRVGVIDPHEWTMRNIWALAAQPEWADAYAPTLTVETTSDPAAWAGIAGADPTIITDAMIASAVAVVIAAETAAAEAAARAAQEAAQPSE